jgi:hypothetical protein
VFNATFNNISVISIMAVYNGFATSQIDYIHSDEQALHKPLWQKNMTNNEVMCRCICTLSLKDFNMFNKTFISER